MMVWSLLSSDNWPLKAENEKVVSIPYFMYSDHQLLGGWEAVMSW